MILAIVYIIVYIIKGSERTKREKTDQEVTQEPSSMWKEFVDLAIL